MILATLLPSFNSKRMKTCPTSDVKDTLAASQMEVPTLVITVRVFIFKVRTHLEHTVQSWQMSVAETSPPLEFLCFPSPCPRRPWWPLRAYTTTCMVGNDHKNVCLLFWVSIYLTWKWTLKGTLHLNSNSMWGSNTLKKGRKWRQARPSRDEGDRAKCSTTAVKAGRPSTGLGLKATGRSRRNRSQNTPMCWQQSQWWPKDGIPEKSKEK